MVDELLKEVRARPTLQRDAELLMHNLNRYQETMNEHRDFLTAAHSYPLPSFPGHTQENVLVQLMRKKLDPKAEDWIAAYAKPKVKSTAQSNGTHAGEGDHTSQLSEADFRELWKWAGPTSTDTVKQMMLDDVFEEDYTIAEREAGVENVATGLKRNLDDDSDEGDGGEDKMEDVMPGKPAEAGVDTSLPPLRLEALLQFTSTGALPPQR
ncbi:hypothetical protein LTR08_000350 [Meristemomyces frigidus]|nr:hypothetical protein LTR08_000350 [Meristemomyces frigidus]